MNEEQLLIEEIHAKFDNAWIGLLEEAKNEIKTNIVKDADYVKKMHQLGFVNSKPVVEAKRKLEIAMANNEKAELILHYNDTYPFLKFLTEEKLDEICEKYNLTYAPVDRYLEEVPIKNMEAIFEAQELKEGDERPEEWKINNLKWHSSMKGHSKELKKRILEHAYDKRPSDSLIRKVFPEIITSWVYEGEPDCTKMDYTGLFIAAPETHFDLKGLERGKTKGFFKTVTKKMPPDPIVFRYVKGGIQVLTKWGIEANDPELANPLDN